MANLHPVPTIRRDPRHQLGLDEATLRVPGRAPDPRRIVWISTTGFGFEPDGDSVFDVGTVVERVRIRRSEGQVEGDLCVRDLGADIGCLFYPASPQDVARWWAWTEPALAASEPISRCLLLRCANCHRTVSVGKDDSSLPRCRACGQELDLGETLRGDGLAEAHRQAVRLAAEMKIDLPSAASLMLGILTVVEVLDVLGESSADESPGAVGGTSARRGFDAAFQPAVDAGTLKPMQAIQRGNRDALARKLVELHGISSQDAYDVADNRTSLLVILRARKAGAPIAPVRPHAGGNRPWIATAVVAGCALLALAGLVRGPRGSEDRRAARQPPPFPTFSPAGPATPDAGRPSAAPVVHVEVDRNGWPTRISAARPQAVLEAFCERFGGEPVSLATGLLHDPRVWLGILHGRDGELRAIAIRKDARSRRWTTGDGTARIPLLSPDPTQLGETHDLAPGPI